MDNKIKVDIQDDDGKTIDTFIVNKMNVSASARRFALSEQITSSNFHDQHKNQLLVCAALVTVLRNVKGELLYPPPVDGGKDDSVDKFAEDMDYEIFSILAKAYSEINPIKSGLKAKKKKY